MIPDSENFSWFDQLYHQIGHLKVVNYYLKIQWGDSSSTSLLGQFLVNWMYCTQRKHLLIERHVDVVIPILPKSMQCMYVLDEQ